MTKIAPPISGRPAVVADTLARIYAQGATGTEARMTNAGDALRQLAHLANYILARCPRINAAQSIQGSLADAVGASRDPQWLFRINDRSGNGRRRSLRVLSLRRTAAPGAGGTEEAYMYGDTTVTTGDLLTGTTVAGAQTYPTDLQISSLTYLRGDRANALESHGLTTIAGFTLCGLVVQDDPIDLIDTDTHDYAPVQGFQAGDKCTALYVERLRAAVQTARENYLPVLAFWSANDALGGNQPSGSDATGFEVTATTLTNIFDGSSTTRTATTPGISCHVQHAGHGPPSLTSGRRVKVAWSVLAATDDGSDAVVQVEGSATHSSNTDSVVVSGATPTWYDGSSGVLLDSATGDAATTTARNKIDILGNVNTGGSLWIYGWRFEMEHI